MINGIFQFWNMLISHFLVQFIRFASVCSNISDFNNRNQILAAELSKQKKNVNSTTDTEMHLGPSGLGCSPF